MADERRCMSLIKESEGIYFDFSRQRVNTTTMEVGCTLSATPRGQSATADEKACESETPGSMLLGSPPPFVSQLVTQGWLALC
jgi:hypothetical protein